MPFTVVNHRGCTSSGAFPRSDVGHVSSGSYSTVGMLLPVFEQMFVVLVLLASMNVVTALSPSSREQTEIKVASTDVDTASVVIEAGIYTFGGMLALLRWRRILSAARTVWPLLALAALASLSTIWSVQPIVTLRRSVGLLVPTVIAIYLGERYSIEAFARLLARTLCLVMMLVLVLYLVAPEYVIDHSAYGGALKGLSSYKNTFGEHMAVAVVLLVLVRFHRFAWTRYLFIVVAASLLLLSRSAAAVVCAVLAVAAIPLWRLMRGKQRLFGYLLVALLFFAGIYCFIAFPEPLLKVLGRDPTLTGRTRLWGILLPVIANQPILGYGYDAFWAGLKPEVLSVWIEAGRLVPIADNGYIDLFLSLGAVGVCLFLCVFVHALRKAVAYIRLEPGFIGVWPVTYLCIFAADNICESALLTRGTFPFLVFAILTTSLAMNHRRVVTPLQTAESHPLIWEPTVPSISR